MDTIVECDNRSSGACGRVAHGTPQARDLHLGAATACWPRRRQQDDPSSSFKAAAAAVPPLVPPRDKQGIDRGTVLHEEAVRDAVGERGANLATIVIFTVFRRRTCCRHISITSWRLLQGLRRSTAINHLQATQTARPTGA